MRKGTAAARENGGTVASFGIDSWAIDFGLLDKNGQLLGNPVHYRDRRTDNMMERVFCDRFAKKSFNATGIQFLPFNTIYQLAAMRLAEHPLLACADTFLMIPDLLAYFLTGAKANEFTNATTTQLLDARTGAWSAALIDKLKLPRHIFRNPTSWSRCSQICRPQEPDCPRRFLRFPPASARHWLGRCGNAGVRRALRVPLVRHMVAAGHGNQRNGLE